MIFIKGGTPELDKWNRMDGQKVSMFHLKHFKGYNL